jgi:putative Mg2+ transporter-C (MgtC) family protein
MTLTGELLIRLFVGTVLGGVIGYERDVHGRPAGLRTHLIVALASTTFMLVSTHFDFQHYTKDDLVAVDTSRIAASVVTGIGFLGGGAILRTGVSVQGLTTAAGLWLVAAIGLSAGAGMYAISVAATVFGLLALALLRRFEHKDERLLRRRIALVFTEGGPPVPTLLEALAGVGVVVSPAEYDRRVDAQRVHVTLQVEVPVGGTERLVGLLESQPGLESVRVEPLG